MKHIGLYLHVPFCASQCPYCNFYKERTEESVRFSYVEALKKDILAYRDAGFGFDTIYFGGGTPSLLKGEWVADLLTTIRQNFSVTEDAEITVECNPSSDLEDFLPKVRAAGVNRVSLGMQSAVDGERKALGRRADRQRVARCISLCREQDIENISIDIMLGVPGQTEESLQDTLAFCVETGVPHISAYMLKLEEGTVFYQRQEKLNLPEEDTVCRFYEQAEAFFSKNGYVHYEISNFCKPGYESRHNLKYWRCEEYLGLGPAAHSYLIGRRFSCPPNLEQYLEEPDVVFEGKGGSFEERLLLALRLKEGFSEPLTESLMEKVKQPYLAPYLSYDGTTLRLTEAGFLVSNTVIAELLSAL